MSTRTARYASYRKHIQNEDMFLKNITKLNEQVKVYKQRIDDISTNILSDIDEKKEDVKIYPFTTINEYDNTEFNVVKEFADKINNYKKLAVTNQIGAFLNEFSQSSIVDKHGNISEVWKNTWEYYPELVRIKRELNSCQDKLINFQINSEKLLNKVNASVEEGNNIDQLKQFAITKCEQSKEDVRPKKMYFTLLILMAVFLFIAIVLCIVGVLI